MLCNARKKNQDTCREKEGTCLGVSGLALWAPSRVGVCALQIFCIIIITFQDVENDLWINYSLYFDFVTAKQNADVNKQLNTVVKTTEESQLAKLNAEKFVEKLQQSIDEKSSSEEQLKMDMAGRQKLLLGMLNADLWLSTFH